MIWVLAELLERDTMDVASCPKLSVGIRADCGEPQAGSHPNDSAKSQRKDHTIELAVLWVSGETVELARRFAVRECGRVGIREESDETPDFDRGFEARRGGRGVHTPDSRAGFRRSGS